MSTLVTAGVLFSACDLARLPAPEEGGGGDQGGGEGQPEEDVRQLPEAQEQVVAVLAVHAVRPGAGVDPGEHQPVQAEAQDRGRQEAAPDPSEPPSRPGEDRLPAGEKAQSRQQQGAAEDQEQGEVLPQGAVLQVRAEPMPGNALPAGQGHPAADPEAGQPRPAPERQQQDAAEEEGQPEGEAKPRGPGPEPEKR